MRKLDYIVDIDTEEDWEEGEKKLEALIEAGAPVVLPRIYKGKPIEWEHEKKMKCKFCGSSTVKMKNVRSEINPTEFSMRSMLLHHPHCIYHLTEKELLLMILERLDECNCHNPS